MRSEKTIAVVGVADEDVARLCLLLRQILPRLEARWRWGVESRADLVIVNPSSFLGMMGWTRAIAAGVRCALIQPTETQQGDYHLSRPFVVTELEAALNSVSRESARPANIEPYLYDFYYSEMGSAAHARKPVPKETEVPQGIDEYLRAHPDRNTGLDGIQLPQFNSLRRPMLAPRIDTPTSPAVWRLEPARQSRGGLSLLHDRNEVLQTPHSLWAYLTGDLLSAPSRLDIVDGPVLVIDPVNRVFHCDALLRSLQLHCDVNTRIADWKPVTGQELQRVRRELPAQPYSKLLWLDALKHAEGRLATHLDPGGMYRLTHWLDIDDSLPRQQRIATCMVQAHRLHEIAELSRTSVTDVFNTVSAFESIGYVEWSVRSARLPHAARSGERISSLVSRLRTLIEAHGRDHIGLDSGRRAVSATSVKRR